MDHETLRLSEMNLVPKPPTQQYYVPRGTEGKKTFEGKRLTVNLECQSTT